MKRLLERKLCVCERESKRATERERDRERGGGCIRTISKKKNQDFAREYDLSNI